MIGKHLICIGAIVGTHGVRGTILVRSFTEDPEMLFSIKSLTNEDGSKFFSFHRKGVKKGDYLADLEGVTDRDAAKALRGTRLYVPRDELPDLEEDEYYEADLKGLTVQADSGEKIGTVTALFDYGAGSFLEIQPSIEFKESKGKSFMLPFKDPFVPNVDVKAGFIDVCLPEGWLADEAQETDEEEAE